MDNTSTTETAQESRSTTLSIRLPVALLDAFKQLAEREFDTPANRIRMLMRADLRQNGNGNGS